MQKYFLSLALFMSTVGNVFSQSTEVRTSLNDERFYVYWGWNRGWFTDSDVHFKGDMYDFTLDEVVAKDRPAEFSLDTYFNPKNISIPQYNLRIGYFLNEKYDISFGVDHMKYVVNQHQYVKINGSIAGTNTIYDGTFEDAYVYIDDDFLLFEHTDGLNYLHGALRRNDEIFKYKAISVQAILGIEAGALMPRTDATLLGMARHDAWHLAGFGVSVAQGLNISFWNKLIIQAELKEGFISMPNIRTTSDKSDTASQHFGFLQFNWNVGGKFKF